MDFLTGIKRKRRLLEPPFQSRNNESIALFVALARDSGVNLGGHFQPQTV
jgi:hypothetical protein